MVQRKPVQIRGMFSGKSCGRNAGTCLKSGTPGGLKLQRRTVMEGEMFMDNSVIERLAAIEREASGLAEKAEQETQELIASYERKTLEFDEEAEASAEKEIADMRAALEKQNEETMHALESQMEQMASVLDQEYESKIDTRADEIVKKILE